MRRARFSVADELATYFDSPAEPNNVHLEAWLPGHLDVRRLHAAVAAVLADQPRTRARRAAGRWWRAAYEWEFPGQPDADPVQVCGWRTEAELDAARDRFLAAVPPLDRSPPFRLLLAAGPGQDSLILNAHHAAFDGRSCLRLLRLIASAYQGGAYQGQAPAPEVARAASRPVAGPVGDPAGPLAVTKARPALIAARHKTGSPSAPGYGYALLGWPDVPRTGAGTVNDLLIAALMRAIARWNRTGERGQIRVAIAVDSRQPGHEGDLGNFSRLSTIAAPDPVTVQAIAAQTAAAKSRAPDTRDPDTAQSALSRAPLPVPVKSLLARLALRVLGRRWCDTTLLSNLGAVNEPPSFGPLSPARMWFSTSAHMPSGLSVGAITVAGRLQLCVRYRYALLDEAAGAEFAAGFADALRETAGREVAGP